MNTRVPRLQLAVRVNTSVLAGVEKRLLIWIAERLPQTVNSDHLTVLGGLAMLGIGVCFWAGAHSRLAHRGRDSAARAELVRRQPRRNGGACPTGRAPALRLLRRPRPRRDRLCRARSPASILGQHMSHGIGLALPVRLLPARHRGGALGARREAPSACRSGTRTDGAADPPRRRRARALAVARRSRSSDRAGCCSTWAVSAGSLGLVLTFAAAAYSQHESALPQEPLASDGRNMIARCPFWPRSTTFSSARRSGRRRSRSAPTSSSRARPKRSSTQARSLRPGLVIFDLNSAKTDPVNTIAALKADPGHRLHPHDRLRVARARRL